MYCPYFKIRSVISHFFILAIIGFRWVPSYAQAQSIENELPSPPPGQSSQKSFWNNIETQWGGRFKTTGTGSRITENTIFAPVGSGNYYDGSANFRLINETFFTDSVFFEVDYELIWAGGDTIRKQNELKEIFPNLSGDVFFLGAPLDDDRRLMDLTHTIKEEDS